MNSSLGYHTFSLYKKLTYKDTKILYNDFKNYSDVFIRPSKNNTTRIYLNNFEKSLSSYRPKYYYINYNIKNKGISWELKISSSFNDLKDKSDIDYKTCTIKAIINPKIFVGILDYVTASSEEYINDVEANFNLEANRISSILGEFNSYLINRIDYCLNLDLKELNLKCNSEQMITLIKRSNIPKYFVERTEYDGISHRMKTDKNTFYLKSNSVVVNCYNKHYQLVKEFPDCPDIDNSLNVIRFEIQCKYLKVYEMFRKRQDIKMLLSDEVCSEIIIKYFDKIIRKGVYYQLETAKRIVRDKGFRMNKEERLINALNLINSSRGISKAKQTLCGNELNNFKRSIKELSDLNINPVTIPKEWNIKFIPNLLNAYYDLVSYEQQQYTLKKNGLYSYLTY